MKIRLYIVCLLIGVWSGFSDKVVAQENPMEFEQFLKEGLKTVEGVFPVYYNDRNVFLEIRESLLGQELLITSQLEQGIGLIGRNLSSPGVVYFTKGDKNNLYLHQEITSERVAESANELSSVLKNSTFQPIFGVYPVIAYSADKKGYIIDVTDVLKNGDQWFTFYTEGVRGLDASKSVIKGVAAFQNGVQLTVLRKYGYIPISPSTSEPVLSLEGKMPVEISCVLKVLPAEAMKCRYAGTQNEYQVLSFWEYGQNPYVAVRDSIIQRWNLSAKHKNRSIYRQRKSVEVIEPIVFYIDSRCPREWIPCITEGVLVWNKVFEQIGFSGALAVKMAPPLVSTATQRAVISYDLGKPGIIGEKVVHPRTGEILLCRISIGHGFLADELDSYLLQCGNIDSRILQDVRDKNVAYELFQNMISREVGRMLGLKDKKECSDRSINTILRNEYRAIEYGYSEKSDSKREDDQINVQWSNELLATLEMKMENLKGIYKQSGNMLYVGKKIDDDGRRLKEINEKGLALYQDYLMDAAMLITENSNTGDCQMGNLAMFFLDKYFFNGIPDWLKTPFLTRNTLEDNEKIIWNRIKPLFQFMVSKEVIENLVYSGDEGYSCDNYLQDLRRIVFKNFNREKPLTAWQMEMQDVFMESFLEKMTSDKMSKNSGVYALNMLFMIERLSLDIKELSMNQQDLLTKCFYENMMIKMQKRNINN